MLHGFKAFGTHHDHLSRLDITKGENCSWRIIDDQFESFTLLFNLSCMLPGFIGCVNDHTIYSAISIMRGNKRKDEIASWWLTCFLSLGKVGQHAGSSADCILSVDFAGKAHNACIRLPEEIKDLLQRAALH